MKAVYVSKEERELQDRPIPSPGQDEVLIRRRERVVGRKEALSLDFILLRFLDAGRDVAVSSNPKDWKQPLYMSPWAAVEGNDIAGYVEKVGEGVTKFKVGDKVAAFTKMRTDDKYGAYAEYSVSPSNTTFHLGPNTSFEDAAALPLAFSTAAIGLFKRLALSEPDQPGQRDGALLIWGGATTVGVYAIQLAKKAGYHVVAVAGSSQDVPRSYGADEVLDYRNKSTSSLASEIRQSYGGKGVKYIYDAVSEGTLDVVAEALKDVEGAKYTYVLPYSEEQLKALPSNVHAERTFCATAYGEESDFAEKWFDWVGKAIEAGEFRAQKVTVMPGGLQGVKEGLRRLQQGEVRGEKLVYRIKDTPGLA